jgi:hypothetical protein
VCCVRTSVDMHAVQPQCAVLTSTQGRRWPVAAAWCLPHSQGVVGPTHTRVSTSVVWSPHTPHGLLLLIGCRMRHTLGGRCMAFRRRCLSAAATTSRGADRKTTAQAAPFLAPAALADSVYCQCLLGGVAEGCSGPALQYNGNACVAASVGGSVLWCSSPDRCETAVGGPHSAPLPDCCTGLGQWQVVRRAAANCNKQAAAFCGMQGPASVYLEVVCPRLARFVWQRLDDLRGSKPAWV